MIKTEGTPRVDINVMIAAYLSVNKNTGIVATCGYTERGDIGKPKLITSWAEYQRHYGGAVTYSNFPLFAKLALDSGVSLLINRIARYTDYANRTTLQATKATKALGGLTFTAVNEGDWGNNLSVTVTDSGATAVTITAAYSLDGSYDFTATLPKTPTAADLKTFNDISPLVKVTGATATAAATANLTGGTYLVGYDAAAYTGAQAGGTGLWAFDEVTLRRLTFAVMDTDEVAVQNAVLSYVRNRKRGKAVMRTPSFMTGAQAAAWVNANFPTGVWQGRWVFGDLLITDPFTEEQVYVHGIFAALGCMAARDKSGKYWLSPANNRFNKIDALGLFYNIATPSRLVSGGESDQVHKAGISPIIDEGGGVVYAGDWTRDFATKMRDGNVADFIEYLADEIEVQVRTQRYEPNVPETWRAIRNIVQSRLEEARDGGISGGEGVGYYIADDSGATDTTDVKFNTPAVIDAGGYNFRFGVKPVGALKYIGVEMVVDNTAVSYKIVGETQG